MTLKDAFGREVTVDGDIYSVEGISVAGLPMAEALDVINAHAPEGYTPPPPPRVSTITALEFWNRFTMAEKAAVAGNPALNVWVITALAAGSVDLTGDDTKRGIDFVVSQGAVKADRAIEILTP